MQLDGNEIDYETVRPSRINRSLRQEEDTTSEWPVKSEKERPLPKAETSWRPTTVPVKKKSGPIMKRGHAVSYGLLFLYLIFVYFRPYELLPGLAPLMAAVFWLGLAVLLVFIPLQLGLENTISFRPREVNLILVFTVLAVLSVIFASNPGVAWEEFNFVFIKAIVIFIVMVNVVRNERRLKGLLLLAISVGCVISLTAVNKYRLGQFDVGDEIGRVVGNIGGMFGNQNDMALHLVTMIPITIALLLTTRNPFKRIIYLGCVLLMLLGNFVTFSRGAFLGLIAGGAVLIWKLRRHNPALALLLIIVALSIPIVLVPGGYGNRVASILRPSGDASGFTRKQLLFDSLYVSVRHPLLGVGMGNARVMLTRGQVSHNAYTQVASEMGLAALVVYLMFMIVPLKSLRRIEGETFKTRQDARFYYLAVGLQSSLICYMVSSFFLSVAYQWNIYFLVAYAICLRRIYEAQTEAREIPANGPTTINARLLAAQS